MRTAMIPIILVAATFALPGIGLAESPRDGASPTPPARSAAFSQATWLDGNRVKLRLTNRGKLDVKAGNGYGGGYWPDTTSSASNVILFDFGPWVVGKFNGIPKMGLSEWGSSYSPGPAVNGQAAMVARPADSLRYRLYKINRGDNAASNPDYRDWPVEFGAPVDAQGKPLLLGDQTVWTVYNNLDTAAPSAWWKKHMPVPALPVVVQQAVYAQKVKVADSTALLANTAFIEWTIINVGTSPIESTYVSLWTDIDFNDVTHNVPAVDTVNQLGYCWQRAGGTTYGPPRAVGFLWLYGPSVPSPGTQARFKGRLRANARNLPLSSFWGIQDDSYPDSSFRGAAGSMGTAWNITRGFDPSGYPILDSVTHQVTHFPYSGDPVTGTGWLCDRTSGGAGFNLFSGPFTLAPGDTQWVMAALIPASDTSRLQCVSLLRQAAATLRATPYEALVLTSAPETPRAVPVAARLEQNYPNPFNPTTTIRYGLPHRTHVTLAVFNTLGQRVVELVNGEIDAGSHEVRFDASTLASGVYFYRLQAGTFIQVRAMALVR